MLDEAFALSLLLTTPAPPTEWAIEATRKAAITAVVKQPDMKPARFEYGLSSVAKAIAKDLWMTRRIDFTAFPEKLSGAKIGITITF